MDLKAILDPAKYDVGGQAGDVLIEACNGDAAKAYELLKKIPLDDVKRHPEFYSELEVHIRIERDFADVTDEDLKGHYPGQVDGLWDNIIHPNG